MSRYSGALWKPIGSGGTTAMTRYDQLVIHTMVGGLYSTDNYFRTQTPNNSHFGLGGKWGSDVSRSLDGDLWQWIDTKYRSAATRDGNSRVIAVECADNAPQSPSDIVGFSEAQQAALVKLMVWAHNTHGIPLVLAGDSRPTTRGIGWHKLGCDPYRVAGGELWSSSYGKVCPGAARIAQIPNLIARAVAIVNGEDDDMTPAQEAKLDEVVRFVRSTGGKGTLQRLLDAVAAVKADTSLQGDDETKILAQLTALQEQVSALTPTPPTQ